MTVYGYCRVSTGRQASEGESLGVQERAIQGYCMMKGLPAPTIFVERGISGSIPLQDRPEGARMLAFLQLGDAIIVPKLDRAFRSATDALMNLERFKRDKVALHLIDLGGDVGAGGISKLLFTILSAVAESERDRIRERIADVKRDQAARGRYLGGKAPFGYRSDEGGQLQPFEPEQAIIGRVLRFKHANPSASLRRVAEAIGGLSHVTVGKILVDHFEAFERSLERAA